MDNAKAATDELNRRLKPYGFNVDDVKSSAQYSYEAMRSEALKAGNTTGFPPWEKLPMDAMSSFCIAAQAVAMGEDITQLRDPEGVMVMQMFQRLVQADLNRIRH